MFLPRTIVVALSNIGLVISGDVIDTEDADKNNPRQPFWIVRICYLTSTDLLLVLQNYSQLLGLPMQIIHHCLE